jgi:hypothetical protein
MYNYLVTLFVCTCLVGCGGAPGDFESPKEKMERERKGSVFGEDALTWKWSKDEIDKKPDTKKIEATDPLWTAVSQVTSEYPISFSNFHAHIIQTDWIYKPESPDVRYRFTVRLLGKEPKADNLEVLMMMEKKQGSNWAPTAPNMSIRHALVERIISEAIRIYDQHKRD